MMQRDLDIFPLLLRTDEWKTNLSILKCVDCPRFSGLRRLSENNLFMLYKENVLSETEHALSTYRMRLSEKDQASLQLLFSVAC